MPSARKPRCRPGTPTVRLRPTVALLALAAVTLGAVPSAAQNEVTVSFEHSSYTVPEGNSPDGAISYV